MRSQAKLFVIAALAAISMVTLATPAMAASFRFEPGGAVEMPSVGKLTFGESEITAECEFTLNTRISNALLPKTIGTVIGQVTAVRINEPACTGGSLEPRSVLGLPWNMKYSSILGTLPERVTAILLTVDRFALNFNVLQGFPNCLYQGEVGFLLRVTGSNPYTSERGRWLPTRVPLVRGVLCPATITLGGSFGLTTVRITRL